MIIVWNGSLCEFPGHESPVHYDPQPFLSAQTESTLQFSITPKLFITIVISQTLSLLPLFTDSLPALPWRLNGNLLPAKSGKKRTTKQKSPRWKRKPKNAWMPRLPKWWPRSKPLVPTKQIHSYTRISATTRHTLFHQHRACYYYTACFLPEEMNINGSGQQNQSIYR